MKRVLLSSLAGVVFLVSGCSSSVDISSVPALTLEEVAGKRLVQMTNDEKEGLIYQYVSDRITVDQERLIKIESDDMTEITSLLNRVTSDLKGGNNNAISEEYANYLLMEFARTPYQWKQTSIDPVGFDPAARLYFVDVTYSTTNTYKNVVPASKIAYGSPDEEVLKQQRYNDYIAYLTYKQRGEVESANKALSEFTSTWGSVDSVMQEQQGTSLVERTRLSSTSSDGLGALTYTGLIEESNLNGGASMTVRYVFKYKFNLGEETDLEVDSLYLKDYTLDNADSVIEKFTESDTTGVEVLKPFIDKLIISYHKAVEESNFQGLYDLYVDYEGIDKYYDDMNKYTYNSIDGYNFQILKRTGTNVYVQVNRVNKIRAKGAEMSLPTYDEVLIYNLVLDTDDTIKIKSANLVSSTLVGEPISVIKNVSGISDLIQYSGQSFTETNKAKVEEALKEFSEVVFNARVDTTEFTDIVDIGVSQDTLKKMSDVITAVPDATRKVNYIVSWDTGTNVYTSVTLREIFETPTGNLDTESVVELVNRDGDWKVVNYTRTLNIKTGSTTLSTKNALSENVR